MKNEPYYLPINAGSLAHYLGKAIILPARYFGNKPGDQQDQLTNAVLLSKNKWTGYNDCAVEVILTEAEQNTLTALNTVQTCFAYTGGIPVSRITAVHFREEKLAETIRWNINSGAAFLPVSLIQVDLHPTAPVGCGQLLPANAATTATVDISEKVKRFDILLGALAFLKVAARGGAEFPRHYFAVLSHFNALIREQCGKAAEKGVCDPDDRLISLFVNKPSRWTPVQALFFDEVNLQTVESAAKKANLKLPKKYGLIELDQLDPSSNVYLLALLATYGNNRQKNLQDLIQNIIASPQLSEEHAEEIALMFGLNIRYSGLRNAYNDKQLAVKFGLETLLDRYTIESIFQYTFVSQKDIRSFPYLDALVKPTERTGLGDSAMILDKVLEIKKKRSGEEEFLEALAGSLPEVQRSLESAALKAASLLLRQLKEKDAQIAELEATVKKQASELAGPKPAPAAPAAPGPAADDLAQLDFTKLKALAKSKKINTKAYSHLKPTQEGFGELIRLIRAHQTLL